MAIQTIGSNLAGFGPLLAGGTNRLNQSSETKRAKIASATALGVADKNAQSRLKSAMIQEAGASQRAAGQQGTVRAGQEQQAATATEGFETQKGIAAANVKDAAESRTWRGKLDRELTGMNNDVSYWQQQLDEWERQENRIDAKDWIQKWDGLQTNLIDARKQRTMLEFMVQFSSTKMAVNGARKLTSEQEADARLKADIQAMVTQNNAVVQSQQAQAPLIKSQLEGLKQQLGDRPVSMINYMSKAMAFQGAPVPSDVMQDRTKLAEWLAGPDGGLKGTMSLMQGFDATTAQLNADLTAALGDKTVLGRTRDVSENKADQIRAEIRRLESMKSSVLQMRDSVIPLGEGQGTLGENMPAWQHYYGGSAVAGALAMGTARGLTPRETIDDYSPPGYTMSFAPGGSMEAFMREFFEANDDDINRLRSFAETMESTYDDLTLQQEASKRIQATVPSVSPKYGTPEYNDLLRNRYPGGNGGYQQP